MSSILKFGNFNVVKNGEDNYMVKIWDGVDKSQASIRFLNKEELKQIRNGINKVLKDC